MPTVAGTCAAWSALTVLYDEHGTMQKAVPLSHSPQLVLTDTQILAEAPVRYLQSGIGDTLVKWYEFAPHIQENEYDQAFQISLHTAKLAIQLLDDYGLQAIQDNQTQQVTNAFREVIDAIIALAGLVGSVSGERFRVPLAHTIHNRLTILEESHNSLHGEKVIFGLIAQFVLEGKTEKEINQFIHQFNDFHLPITLKQLGIVEDVSKKVKLVAKDFHVEESTITGLSFEVNSNLVEKAIIIADKLGSEQLFVATE